LIKGIKEKWSDETLSIEDKITGQGDMWSRGKTLGHWLLIKFIIVVS